MRIDKYHTRLACWVRNIPESWKTSLPVFLLARLLYTIWGAVVWGLGLTHTAQAEPMYNGVRPIIDGWPGALIGVWQRWDAIHYIRIAERGYASHELTAFFPLYPWLGGLLHRAIGIDTTLALLLVSNLAFLLALVVLFEITSEQYSTTLAKGVVAAAALFPTAVFFFAPYPLSLALFLALFSYQSARNNRWLAAVLSGLAAGLCHSTVLPLVLLLAWEAVRMIRAEQGSIRLTLLAVPTAPLLGTGAFLAWRVYQGYPPFQQLLAQEWGRTARWPWQTMATLPELFRLEKFATVGWLNLAMLLFSLALLVWGIKKLKVEDEIYFGLMLISLFSMNVTGEPLSGVSRYLLPAFPVYISLAMLASSPWVRRILMISGLLLAFYASGLFFMWIWLA